LGDRSYLTWAIAAVCVCVGFAAGAGWSRRADQAPQGAVPAADAPAVVRAAGLSPGGDSGFADAQAGWPQPVESGAGPVRVETVDPDRPLVEPPAPQEPQVALQLAVAASGGAGEAVALPAPNGPDPSDQASAQNRQLLTPDAPASGNDVGSGSASQFDAQMAPGQ